MKFISKKVLQKIILEECINVLLEQEDPEAAAQAADRTKARQAAAKAKGTMPMDAMLKRQKAAVKAQKLKKKNQKSRSRGGCGKPGSGYGQSGFRPSTKKSNSSDPEYKTFYADLDQHGLAKYLGKRGKDFWWGRAHRRAYRKLLCALERKGATVKAATPAKVPAKTTPAKAPTKAAVKTTPAKAAAAKAQPAQLTSQSMHNAIYSTEPGDKLSLTFRKFVNEYGATVFKTGKTYSATIGKKRAIVQHENILFYGGKTKMTKREFYEKIKEEGENPCATLDCSKSTIARGGKAKSLNDFLKNPDAAFA